MRVLRPAEQLRHRADVRGDGLVREQPDLLDHVADVAAQLDRVGVGDVVAVEEDAARRRLDQPVDHLQRRRLAATRRADEHADLAVAGCRATSSPTATVPFGYCLLTASRRIIGTCCCRK